MQFWRVTVQLHEDKPEDTMKYVFPSRRTSRCVMREYQRLFPAYYHVSVQPSDQWGRVWWQTQSLCDVCGQPDFDATCSHDRLPDDTQTLVHL